MVCVQLVHLIPVRNDWATDLLAACIDRLKNETYLLSEVSGLVYARVRQTYWRSTSLVARASEQQSSASGGYYVAAGADAIFAEETTTL